VKTPQRLTLNDQEMASMHDDDQRPDATGMTRRTLVGAGTAGAAGLMLPTAAGAATRPKQPTGTPARRADVAIVGGGLAGLTAARALVAKGHSVVVLEARRRVGGRTLNAPVGNGAVVEVGGQWVGPGQDRIMALAASVGVKTFKSYTAGAQIFEFQGTRKDFSGLIPPLPSADAAEFNTVLGALETLRATVPLDAPYNAPNARALDGQTVETWKLANAQTAGARFLIDLIVESVYAAEPRDMSMLHFLFYANSGGGLINLTSTAGGAQDSRFIGGSQEVSIRVAGALGRRVVLGAPARRITAGSTGAVVRTDAGDFHAKRVIVACSPALASRIDYEPILPALRDQLTQRVPQGSAIKFEAVYDTPFWRANGQSGYTNSDISPVKLTYDNSPPSGRPGVLLGFVLGEDARVLGQRSAAARRAAVLGAFTRLYGAQAAGPRQLLEHNWSEEEWTRGCYVGFMPPGVWADYGSALRTPVGRIHWAGTETSEVFCGYMDGAVRSGERAAREVLAEL
jgi:monoamine oxidase